MLKPIAITMITAFSAQKAFPLEVRCGNALWAAKYIIEDGAEHAMAVNGAIFTFPPDEPVKMPVYEQSDNLVILGNGDPKIRAHIILSPIPKMEIYSEGELFQTDPCEIISP